MTVCNELIVDNDDVFIFRLSACCAITSRWRHLLIYAKSYTTSIRSPCVVMLTLLSRNCLSTLLYDTVIATIRCYSGVKPSNVVVACGVLVLCSPSSLLTAPIAMATVADICQELADIDKFYMSRAGSASATQLLNNMVAGVVAKIASLSEFNVRTAMSLIDSLDKLSHTTRMSPALVQQVQDSIDARMAAATAQLPSAAVVPKARGGGVTQELRAPYNFLTSSDVDGLRDMRSNTMTMVNIVAHRLCLLGVKHPDEQTIKMSVAMIVSALSDKMQQFPGYRSIYNIVTDLKAAIESTGKRPYPVTPPTVYPETSDELRTLYPAVFAHAYAQGDLPVATCFDRLHMITSHVPLRSNNKLLKGCHGANNSKMGGDVVGLLNELRSLVNRDDPKDVPMTIVGGARQRPASAAGAAVGKAHALCDASSASDGHAPIQCGVPLALRDADREPDACASRAAVPADSALQLVGAGVFRPGDANRGRAFGSLEAPAPVAIRAVAPRVVDAPAKVAGSPAAVIAGSPSDGPSAEDFEKAAIDALKTRNAKRAAVAKAKASAGKSCKSGTACKAVATAADVMTATSRNSFSSTAYNKAFKDTLTKTKSKVKAKTAAQAAYKKAGELWAKKRM